MTGERSVVRSLLLCKSFGGLKLFCYLILEFLYGSIVTSAGPSVFAPLLVVRVTFDVIIIRYNWLVVLPTYYSFTEQRENDIVIMFARPLLLNLALHLDAVYVRFFAVWQIAFERLVKPESFGRRAAVNNLRQPLDFLFINVILDRYC